jgi:iron complex outermembrane receptor protein
MKTLILSLLLAAFSFTFISGQNTIRAFLRDSETKEPLNGATASLKGTTNGSSSGTDGKIEIKNVPSGLQTIIFSYISYEKLELTFNFPLADSLQDQTVFLHSAEEEIDEVVVTATRSRMTIDNIPTRVETISGEELGEKGNMKPGDIRMMLNESTGIQTQQTSATSYNSSIRIQGLDGRYTQILKDGFPLYSGFSGGLSLLQIVPLDLIQVEVIKGASSTLYGGGAIAGLVNLVSKTPKEKRALEFLLNGTSALGLDASGFFSNKSKKVGTTVFVSYSMGTPYDPSRIGLTAIPKYNRYTINPKLFYYFNDNTTLNIGFNNTVEDRIGGDIKYIDGKGDGIHSYFEKNHTNRFSTQLVFDRKANDKSKFAFKNSLSYYYRTIEIPDFKFAGVQLSSFSEVNYNYRGEKVEWIAGGNLWTDKFTQDITYEAKTINYNHSSFGVFVQNTWNTTNRLILETGFRGDYQNKYGFFALPRISALIKVNSKLTARIGGGLGYKIPSLFTEDAERIQFRNVMPVDDSKLKAEQSAGGNFDVNYKSPLSKNLFLTVNSLFFYTRVNSPLVLVPLPAGIYEFQQPEGFIDTKGVETNIRLSAGDFKLLIGYTLADVLQHYSATTVFPLVARHRLNNVLMYEIEDKLKIGLEAYYFSRQKLNDGSTGKAYWICGIMAEKLWEHFSIFINLENLTDTRQTKFDIIYIGTITNPSFRDIYAPLDGFVINGGLKIRL